MKREKKDKPAPREQAPALTLPAVRCPICGGEMTCRTSERMDVPLYDPATGQTWSQRQRRIMRCVDADCGGSRVVNVPLGETIG